MKKIILFSLFVFAGLTGNTQAPQSFKYQAVVRNSTGEIISNQAVSFRILIVQDLPSGDSVYVETHNITTNQFGVANLEIGMGTVESGIFSDIDWDSAEFFLKIYVDPSGGVNYEYLGTTQLLSVPYALYAESGGEWSKDGNDISYTEGKVGIGTNSPQNKLDVNGSINSNSTFKINNSDILKILPGYGTLFVGNFSGSQNSLSYYTTSVGQGAGYYSDNSNYNTYVGSSAGVSAHGSGNSFLGTFAGNQISGSSNTSVGFRAFGRMDLDSIIGDNNSMFGSLSGMNTVNASDNVYLGYQSGYANSNGNNNVFIGSNSGTQSSSSSSVFIGKDAGSLIIGDNLLFIENSNSTTPLIYGEFDNDILGFNGQVGIGTMDPGVFDLKVIGNSELNGDLNVTGLITGDGSGLTNLPEDDDWTVSGNNMYAGISGNVGIGYSAPASKLHIFSTDWDDHLIIERAGNPRGHISLGNNNMVLWVGSGSGLYVNNAGNIGVGVTPNEKLQVDGAVLLGNTTNSNAGTIRWTGSDFEGYDGSSWLSLTSGSKNDNLQEEIISISKIVKEQKILIEKLQNEIEQLKNEKI